MRRMILAKLLYDNGVIATATGNDRLRFAQGIINYHDAVDLSLGAIADHLNIISTKKTVSLLDFMDIISKGDIKERKIPCSQQLKTLNTLRNDIKHEGILPDPESNKHFPATITTFFNEICLSFFGLDFSQINLIALISSQELKELLVKAETAITKQQYELSFETLSLVIYNIIEKDFLQSQYNSEDKFDRVRKVGYPESENIKLTVKLLEHGVDLKLYKNLHALIPYAGLNYETGEIVYRKVKAFSHDGNWTEENARMCLSFVIDLALKFQEPEPFTLQHYTKRYIDIVEPLNDNLTIFSACPGTGSINSPMARIIAKGQSISGMVYDVPDQEGLWIIETLEDPSFIGSVLKSQVKVTTKSKSHL